MSSKMLSNSNIQSTLDIHNLCAISLDKSMDDQIYTISNFTVSLSFLLGYDTLAPVIVAMSDMLMESVFEDEDFKSLFPVLLEKKSESLCYASIKPNKDYSILNSGSSLVLTSLLTMHIMENILKPTLENKVNLSHLVEVWRSELAGYSDGEIIDIRKHKENLIDNNLSLFPSLRQDLINERKDNLKNSILNKDN